MNDQVAVSCRGLRKTYPGKPPVEAVRGVDLELRRGECFGVLGPNGAGKTTTIEILEGLMAPSGGEVRILGRTWREAPHEIRQRIGVSLQETVLSDRLTVGETLRLFRSFYRDGISVEQALHAVSLQPKATSWVKKLSGGQKQRLAVATALVGDPELLFLDEPTTGLDPASRRELWAIIRRFQEEGRTILLTTHYMDEAERLCDRVAIFDQGKIIAEGTPRELIATLGAEHVIEFALSGDVAREVADRFRSLPSVVDCENIDGRFRLRVCRPHEVLPALLQLLEPLELQLTSLSTRHASLEDVFVHITGRSLEDEAESNEE